MKLEKDRCNIKMDIDIVIDIHIELLHMEHH